MILVIVLVLLYGAVTVNKYPRKPFTARNYFRTKVLNFVVNLIDSMEDYIGIHFVDPSDDVGVNAFYARTCRSFFLSYMCLLLNVLFIIFLPLIFFLNFFKNIVVLFSIIYTHLITVKRFVLQKVIFFAISGGYVSVRVFNFLKKSCGMTIAVFLTVCYRLYYNNLLYPDVVFQLKNRRSRFTKLYGYLVSVRKQSIFYAILCAYFYDLMYVRKAPLFSKKVRFYERFFYYRSITHSYLLEIFWTLLPSFILITIAIPSIFVLYIIDEPAGYVLSVFKVIGHQWYWSYEIADISIFKHSDYFNSIIFDSFMVPTSDILPGQLRLLEVDNPLFVPTETPLAFIVTADDVLHSWAVPSLGIKIDAVPGRLNQVYCFITRAGEFYGQCSELCGVHHGFMPIHIIAV